MDMINERACKHHTEGSKQNGIVSLVNFEPKHVNL